MPNIRQPADGAPGPVGPPGKLGIVRDHVESRVYYERDIVVAVDGARYQANRDTAAASSLVDCSLHMDEAFYVLEGGGTFTLNDVHHPCERGGTIFIPRKTWHGFSNPDQELVLLWVIVPPGLERFFRETCNPPGELKKELTREQINAIALKYGTEFR
jgi:mannose-6-phosphate isomerase-like protein (cupin superfamily)